MPKGKVHLAVELLFLPPTLAGAHALGLREELLPLGLGYLAGSLLLSPDLDLGHSHPSRRWRFLRFVWWPYARLFRHRGLSHHPLFGPLTRLLYLSAGLALGGLILRALGLPPPRPGLPAILPGIVGLWIPQLLHLLLDRL